MLSTWLTFGGTLFSDFFREISHPFSPVEHSICHILGMVGPIDVKQKINLMLSWLGYIWPWPLTLNFDFVKLYLGNGRIPYLLRLFNIETGSRPLTIVVIAGSLWTFRKRKYAYVCIKYSKESVLGQCIKSYLFTFNKGIKNSIAISSYQIYTIQILI